MLELFLNKPGELIIREAALLPAVKDNEVKVEVIYGGICGSDISVYKGKLPHAKLPLRPGHEMIGRVIEAGKKSGHVVGTKVTSFPNTYCEECSNCKRGLTNICENKKGYGVMFDGVFGQQIIMEGKYAVPVQADIPDELAVLIEPLAVTIHSFKKPNIQKGESVAIVGCGTEGLFYVALCAYVGAKITVIDINPLKEEIAQRITDVKFLQPQNIGDKKFDVVIEAAGVKATIEQAQQIVRPGGRILGIGLTGEQVNYDVMKIVRGEVTIYGSIIYTKDDFAEAIKLLQDPKFNVAPVVSKVVSFLQYQQAYNDAIGGNYAKIVLDFGGK